jgi:hypothetical protein
MIELTGTVSDGTLKLHNRKLFDTLLCQFNGKDVIIKIQKQKKIRSNYQNRYYFGVVIPIIQQGLFDVQAEWLSVDEIHAFLKQNFNYKELVNKRTGEVVAVAKTTADLATIEFEEYLDRCRAFADEFLNIIIPMPNEQVKIGY